MSKKINNNKPKKTNIPDNNNVLVRWLKRIFSAQTITIFLSGLSLFVAIVGAYYGYKSYKDNQIPDLSVEYHIYGQYKKLQGKSYCINLISASYRTLFFEPLSKYGRPSLGVPFAVNRSNKTIKDFNLEVIVCYASLVYNIDDINPDYEILKDDTLDHELKLKYKYNFLAAHKSIPMPLTSLSLPESQPISDEKSYRILFAYLISYNGISEPCDFVSRFDTYFCHTGLTDKQIDDFLSESYNNCFFDEEIKDKVVVSVIDGYHQLIVNPPTNIKEQDFEKYKTFFIKNYKTFNIENCNEDSLVRSLVEQGFNNTETDYYY